jgi:hypothetical protein
MALGEANYAAFDDLFANNRAEADRQIQTRMAELQGQDRGGVGKYQWSGQVNLGQFGTYDSLYYYAVQSLREGYDANEVSSLISQYATEAPKADAPPEATPTAPGSGPTSEQKSARAYIDELLGQWGLGDLSGWAWDQIQAGNVEMLPQLIRGTDQYKARFKGLEARRAAGLNVMSEAQYLNLENDYREVMHRYGIPRGSFDTQDYLATLIANDLSPSEVNDRLRIYQDAAFNAPAEVRQQLQSYYGVTEGGLMAYYIDPERALPALAAQYAAAGVGSAATRGGFGALERQTAERIAQLGGTGQDMATFENLARSGELFTGLGGSEADQAVISREAAAEAAFGGNATEAERMRKRAEGRVAAFAGGGGFAQSNQGVTGLGDTSN